MDEIFGFKIEVDDASPPNVIQVTSRTERQWASRVAGLEAQLKSARKVIEHYGDYKTWPGDNPQVNVKAWARWYEAGGYHGYDKAREWLKQNPAV